MQRLLVVLVLVLLIAVAALGIAVYNLGDEVNTTVRQPLPARPVSLPGLDSAAAQQAAEQQRKIDRLEAEIAALRRELRARPDPSATLPMTPGGGTLTEGGPTPVVLGPGTRPRDANGELIVTQEDTEFFAKVQEHVLREQRIDNQTRSVMLRVDRMAGRGEIVALAPDRRGEVERVLRRFVAAGDDLTARYLRTPDEEIRNLTNEQRREELVRERTELVGQAQQALDAIVGPEDARKIAEESLHRPWGLGRASRRFENDR